MPMPRQTHTVAELPLSPSAYDEIAAALRAAGYDHVFLEDGLIDMSGIGVTKADDGLTHAERLDRMATELRASA